MVVVGVGSVEESSCALVRSSHEVVEVMRVDGQGDCVGRVPVQMS